MTPLVLTSTPADKQQYVGRFAPSPSGQLHFGSLVAAVGSYLQAKANQGIWLVRIEDIDPPREVPHAADDILKTLEIYGLHWDKPVLYQSQQSHYYQGVLDWLAQNDKSYGCQCSRKQMNLNAQIKGVYQRTCRDLQLNQPGCAIRLKNDNPVLQFSDALQGRVCVPVSASVAAFADDFIIHRKDGLFAYQLAVVVDDILQGVSEVVRGCDLLSTTLHQMTLYQTFGFKPVSYLHLPVAVTETGKKLSKQNHATAVSLQNPQQTLISVLQFLQLPITAMVREDLLSQRVDAILQWAILNWSVQLLPKQTEQQIDLP
jgi:glutamyl-Q tRNA(Asp) synthetase